MTFLSPTLLWGLFAASIPIIIHLFSLTKTKEMEFSSIRFLEEMKHESIRKLQIKQWLLVLLRSLIIVALTLMLARPTTEGSISPWLSGDEDSKAIIIIDNSASMSLEIDDRSLLENAKEQSRSLIKKLDENTHLEIYQTNPLLQIFSGKQDRTQRINQAINNIQQTMVHDDIWNGVEIALSETSQDEINKECFIFSDLQTYPDTTTIHHLNSQMSDWILFFIGQESVRDNMGIHEVSPANPLKLPDHLMNLNTLVSNDGKIEKRNVPIELYLNGNRVGQVVTAFDPQRTKEFLFQAYPGKSGVIRGSLKIPDDDFSYDNMQTFELSIPQKISCMLIGRSVEDIFLVEEALRSISGENDYVSINRKVMPEIDKLFLEKTDVLILHRPDEISKKALDDIQSFTKRGGGLIWFSEIMDKPLDPDIVSALKLPVHTKAFQVGNESYYQVEQVDEEHPLFADMMVRRMSNELPQLSRFNRVRPRSDQKIILSINNGDPYLLDYRLLGGTVYFFSSPIGLQYNDLAMRGLFVPLLHRMLILLATDESNTLPAIAGEEKIIHLSNEFMSARWEVFSPSGKRTLVIPDYNKNQLIIDQTNVIGSYEVYADEQFYTAFSTRLDPLERPGKRVEASTFINLFGNDRVQYISPGKNTSDVLQDIRYGKALWRHFLILAIILLLLESIIGRPNLKNIKSSN